MYFKGVISLVFIFVSVTWLLFQWDLVKTVYDLVDYDLVKIYWQHKISILENDLHTGFARFFWEFIIWLMVNLLQYSGTTKHLKISQNFFYF